MATPVGRLRDHPHHMVVGKQVEIHRIARDRYGRMVGELFLAGSHVPQSNVQRLMVASGYAEI